MANTPPSPNTSERTHKLKTYLNKLQLPLAIRSRSTTSACSSSASTSPSPTPPSTRNPSPATATRPKGDDSILPKRIKLKLTGDAKPGSHSACWGLTPDGQKHEPKYVDASEISGAVDFQDEPEKRQETVKMWQ
jgi:hypothetical protein